MCATSHERNGPYPSVTEYCNARALRAESPRMP